LLKNCNNQFQTKTRKTSRMETLEMMLKKLMIKLLLPLPKTPTQFWRRLNPPRMNPRIKNLLETVKTRTSQRKKKLNGYQRKSKMTILTRLFSCHLKTQSPMSV
jgi:hypothetical protein